MTIICGYAKFRAASAGAIGVGVGEAGTSPPSHAMIADMYAPITRHAAGDFRPGINIGLLIAFLVVDG